jgi:hypothetical protein
MSIKISSKIWESKVEKGADLLVWLALADYANEGGKCWPSIPTIAKRCGYSTRYVTRIIGRLKARGRINLNYRTGHSTMYKVITPEPQFVGSGEQQAVGSNEPQFIGGMNPSSPRTVIEPSLEPSLEPLGVRMQKTRVRPSVKKSKDIVHDAIAEFTKSPPGSFNGKVTAQLKAELPNETSEEIAAKVHQRFGPGGLWYRNDWRGRKGDPPTIQQVHQEWNRVLGVPSKAAQYDAATRQRYIEGPFAAFIEH